MKCIILFIVAGVIILGLICAIAMLLENVTKPKRKRKPDVQVSDNIDDIIKNINSR